MAFPMAGRGKGVRRTAGPLACLGMANSPRTLYSYITHVYFPFDPVVSITMRFLSWALRM
jgi:hypothetical protein